MQKLDGHAADVMNAAANKAHKKYLAALPPRTKSAVENNKSGILFWKLVGYQGNMALCSERVRKVTYSRVSISQRSLLQIKLDYSNSQYPDVNIDWTPSEHFAKPKVWILLQVDSYLFPSTKGFYTTLHVSKHYRHQDAGSTTLLSIFAMLCRTCNMVQLRVASPVHQ